MADAAVEMLFGGIQAAGGAALAVYTYETSANPIWSIGYSGVALAGVYNVCRSVIKIFQKSPTNGTDASCTVRNVVSGTLIYFGSVYGFNEAWRCNDKLSILCLGTALSGFTFAVSSMESLEISFALRPYLKLCQMAFEPALSVCGTIYLLYFRNHEEECLFWVPILMTGYTGLNVAVSADMRVVYVGQHLLLKSFEMFLGGSLLAISSTVLAIYFSRKEFPLSCTACMIVAGYGGVYEIFFSIICLMKYFDMEEEVSGCFGGMMSGHILFFTGCLVVKCIKHITSFLTFLFLAGCGHALIWVSFYDLYFRLPWEVFVRYCRRVLGSLLAVYASAGSVFIAHRMGWRCSLPTIALVPAGAYIAYKGFRRIDGNYE